MSSIGSVGSMVGMAAMQGLAMHRRPDPTQMAGKLFDQLDTSGQGYLEKTDFESAFANLSSSATSSSSTVDVESVFSALDGDSDGKVTESELSAALTQLADQLEQQFQSQRMSDGMAGMQGMPPPPPPPNDTGFTQEELQSQLDAIGSDDSERANLLSSIVNNFSAADADGDGKVTFKEAMAYQESQSTTTSTSATATSTSTATASSTTSDSTTASSTTASSTTASSDTLDSQVLQQIMRLMQAYGQDNQTRTLSSLLEITA